MATIKAEKKSIEKKVTPVKPADLTVVVYDIKGQEKEKISLPKEIFAVEVAPNLLAQAVRVYQANQRQGNASTQTRGEVTASTRKIYRQKGTGRARHGSVKAPIFVGGGVVGGPQPRDYSLAFNKQQKRKAFFGALTLKLKNKEIAALSETGLDKVTKTNIVYKFLKSLNQQGKKTTIILPNSIRNSFAKAARNIKDLELVSASSLNTYGVLQGGRLIFLESAVTKLKEHFKS